MKIHHATTVICTTILLSVAAILYNSYQQEQYIVNSNSQFVTIFDRKHRTLNICDKTECRMMAPEFEPHKVMRGEMLPQVSSFLGSQEAIPAGQSNIGMTQQIGVPQQQMAQTPIVNPQQPLMPSQMTPPQQQMPQPQMDAAQVVPQQMAIPQQ